MKEFWVDFSGYMKIKAPSPGDAEYKAWELFEFIQNPQILMGEVEIDAIEENKEDDDE